MPNYANLAIEIIKLYMNCGIIAVLMGIILSIIGKHFWALLKSILGKNLSIIGRGLPTIDFNILQYISSSAFESLIHRRSLTVFRLWHLIFERNVFECFIVVRHLLTGKAPITFWHSKVYCIPTRGHCLYNLDMHC